MGEKCIVISDCIIEDLIYGRLKGPVISDAPKGMKITGVFGEMTSFLDHTGKINVRVEHPDFEEVVDFAEIPILEIQFSTKNDLTTEDLIKKIREIATGVSKEGKIVLDKACEMLTHNQADRQHSFEDYQDLDKKCEGQRATIDNIIAILKHFE